jgi:SAM-dependent methyltransferase
MSAARPAAGARRAVRADDADQRRRAALRLRRRGRVRSFMQHFRRRLGLPQVLIVDGVRYAERDPVPLHRAVSAGGTGVKEYTVRFPGGQGRMRIRCTPRRVFADLATDPRLSAYEHGVARLRPGMRVLELGCGTGAGSAMIARAVGPSGGLISLGTDRESIRYARRRYRYDHIAFEIGGVETLAGELDGSYDAVFVDAAAIDPQRDLAEAWRCTAGGGWMLVASTAGVAPPRPDLPSVAVTHRPEPGVALLERAPADPPPPRARPSLDQ